MIPHRTAGQEHAFPGPPQPIVDLANGPRDGGWG
jgi:hypothetical protein